MTYLSTAILLGLFSGLHCVGMCGPIVMALPSLLGDRTGKWYFPLLYNGGRIGTYVLLGVLFGMVGKGLSIAGWQQGLSLGLGLVILGGALIPGKLLRNVLPYNRWTHLLSRSQGKIRGIAQKHPLPAAWLTGMVNGLLPCGAVYLALAGALATGSIGEGGLYMVFFGLGTLPVMLALAFGRQWSRLNTRLHFQRALPYLAAFFGLLLILRGLDLGIPYVSPWLNGVMGSVEGEGCYVPR